MVERIDFVPFRRPARNSGVLAAGLLAAAAACAAETAAPPDVVVHARALAPGEIARVELRSPSCAAKAPEGRFLDRPLAFVPEASAAPGSAWSAWAVVPLDQAPGDVELRVVDPCAAPGTPPLVRTLTIEAKSFPEQKLTVSDKYVNPPKSAQARIAREQKKVGAIYARRSPLPPATDAYVAPVPGDPTSEFGAKRILNGVAKSPHPGIDLRAATGTEVLAAGPGTVALAEDLYYSGGTIIVDHGGGLFTIYAHLSKMTAKVGAKVAAGAPLGLSGATGRVTGPHLHWGARVGSEIFDPRALLDPRLFR